MCHTSVHWVSALPAVLLGLRTVFKEDLLCSPAEMVYGENLCLPSQFFVQQQPQAADNGFIKKLKTHIQQLRATPTSNHSAKPTFVYRDLSVCSHVFLRVDAVQPSLSQPYTGPYKVLSRTNKNQLCLCLKNYLYLHLEGIGKLQPAVDSTAGSAADELKDCRNYRLFVTDKQTGLRFLVDSSADLSIIPATSNHKICNSFKLYAANGTVIPTFGFKILTLDLGLRRSFQFPFVIAKVDRAILGADFLTKFQLIISMHNKKLIDGVTNLSIRSHIACVTSADSISTTDKKSRYANLLLQYPNLTKPNLLICNSKHNVKHYIATKGPPVFSKARQLDGNKLKLAKQEFKFMLENDIIRPSKSPWASPLHLVSKKDGSLRPCGDYRRLNAQTIPDRYPIPRIEDFHHILKQTKIFSKIDLFKAYFQIPVPEDDKQKTAIITPFGLYEFNVMNFGLRNAPSTFQQFINEVFFGLDFVFAYSDDILAASSTEDEHSEHLKVVFSRLEQYGLRINLGESVLGMHQLEFLGYMITPEGSKPLPEKVNVILNYRLPETIHQLRTFLGLINFYRRYIKYAAKNQAVLHEYLKGTKKKDKSKIPWTKEAKEKFEQCKKDLANATLLSFPNPDSPLALFTDASLRSWSGTATV
ncbi:Transposon Ty3-I Gag-Pol polyprotein [Araneus ventricosus]|uniref:RNA-directed DNA polymerase n=1 Tax=Araneus ventricosus TaxID=182803 RepID=A0A4Y2EQX9_ARAVE|nr:Transposon Ty3-I Gag-Pol polyprotein [Araneus ventricosus]